jgi:Spy/CpxP family protein refolding chaperone
MFAMLFGASLIAIGTAALIHHRRGMHRAMFGCAMKRLKATPEQRQRLTELFENTHTRLSVTRERGAALRRELADLLVASELDAKQIETLEAHLFEVVAEGSQILRDSVAQVRQILGVEQRQKLAEWLRRAPRCHAHAAHCHC